ncbi:MULTISPECIES: cysteine hydrolase family protein [Sellimonas]|uniref:Cysteine hydrolase n=1 Tax=Sellimonas caecigallum TaxID=2592333 RepID=A0ABS7LAF7_9FIRM|nr:MULTISPECIES: isochorismatase family cysteine hydrolase [Sellimonas]MBY0759854.1 cysteine hydrolase [Sellimonas caecigallum]
MKELLVVVDIQNDFVTGSLGTKEAQEIVQNARKKIESYEQDNKEIVFTRDTHEENYLMTQEGRNLPVKHCIRGTEGWEIIPELQEYTKGRRIFDKPSFGSIDLASYIRDGGYDRVEFIGLCTDICVVSNALLVKAYVPEITVAADASCCAGVTPQSHDSALCTMKMCQIEINYK